MTNRNVGQVSVGDAQKTAPRESEIFGIEVRHHYGVTAHPLVEGETPAQTVYGLVRGLWHKPKGSDSDVLDDNHTWEDVPAKEPQGFSRVRLIKNDKSPRFARILGLASWLYEDGPGATWFTCEYRVATRAMIDAEIADLMARAARWDADAQEQRDTIRGRKQRQKLRGFAANSRLQAALVAKRWPEFLSDGAPSRQLGNTGNITK